MKRSLQFSILTLMGFLISCATDVDQAVPDLVGDWQLVEVLADPGDGSGVFQPVNSDKTITFTSEGTIRSSVSLCPNQEVAPSTIQGRYSLEDSTITLKCSSNLLSKLFFEQQEEYLLLYVPCIEPCAEKYIKQ